MLWRLIIVKYPTILNKFNLYDHINLLIDQFDLFTTQTEPLVVLTDHIIWIDQFDPLEGSMGLFKGSLWSITRLNGQLWAVKRSIWC